MKLILATFGIWVFPSSPAKTKPDVRKTESKTIKKLLEKTFPKRVFLQRAFSKGICLDISFFPC
jgi:hypothetical protein